MSYLITLRDNLLHGLTNGTRCSTLSRLTELITLRDSVLHGLAHGPCCSMHTSMAYSIRFVYVFMNTRHPGIKMVMEAFVRYRVFVNDKIEPNKAYVDPGSLKSDKIQDKKHVLSLVRIIFNIYFL